MAASAHQTSMDMLDNMNVEDQNLQLMAVSVPPTAHERAVTHMSSHLLEPVVHKMELSQAKLRTTHSRQKTNLMEPEE